MHDVSLISVVDDDESLEGLLKALGYGVQVFSSAESFLGSDGAAELLGIKTNDPDLPHQEDGLTRRDA